MGHKFSDNGIVRQDGCGPDYRKINIFGGSDMKYVVIDLEMCKVPRSLRTEEFRWCQETIQIGAVLLDEKYEVVDRFNTFIRPEYGRLDSVIRKLTGIEYTDLMDAPKFEEAITSFLNWVPTDEFRCVSWSDSDSKQIEHEMLARNIANDKLFQILDEWIDCQKTFGEKMDSTRAYSLEEALVASDIYQEGRAHDGLTDAINTAKLFTKLEQNPDYALNAVYMSAKDEAVEHLGFSLGDLIGGLTLQLAG